MKFLRNHKKTVVASLALAVALLGGGVAYAFFTSSGAGTGSANTGTGSTVSISQVGAGYNSLIPSMTYSQDQCMQGCTGPSELGDSISLANTGDQQLTSVVLAVRNWGPAITAASLTVNINNTVAGPVSYTQTFNIPAAATVNADPTTTNLTFNLASEGIFVQDSFIYGFTLNDPLGAPPTDPAGEQSLNIALASSATNLSVGTDNAPGNIWLADSNGPNNDFPTCDDSSFPTSSFVELDSSCGPSNLQNPGAYGPVGPASDDIPAVEFNVVGGTTLPLYPGGPSQPVDYAITNSGSSSVYVQTVVTSVTGVSSLSGPSETCEPTMYVIGNPTVDIDANIAPGTTVYSPSGSSISMTDDHNNQDNCEGQVVRLGFVSN